MLVHALKKLIGVLRERCFSEVPFREIYQQGTSQLKSDHYMTQPQNRETKKHTNEKDVKQAYVYRNMTYDLRIKLLIRKTEEKSTYIGTIRHA